MGSNLSNKTQKKEVRLKNPMDPIQLPDSLANVAKHPCHRAGLHLALSSTLNPAPVIPGSHNHRGNVSNLKKLLSTDLDPALRFYLLS
jgi:hypothetical protein